MKPSDDQMQWEDISAAAEGMFRVWNGDGQITWVEECWRHLSEAGLTGNSTILETTETCLRLVALARIYEEFCGLAWYENPETPISYLAEDFEIDLLALGIIAATSATELLDAVHDKYELYDLALLAAPDARRPEFFQCLCNAYDGEIGLYSRMSKTNQSAGDEDDEDEFDGTTPNADAFAYVKNGFKYD